MVQQITFSRIFPLRKYYDYGTYLPAIGKVRSFASTPTLITDAMTFTGYNAPENLQNYATYLDTRIRAYRDLKHDAIRVQSETNRDMRNSQAIDEGRLANGEKPIAAKSGRRRFGSKQKEPVEEPPAPSSSSSGVQRSKTMAGRKLRIMTVEKGLLRETKTVQKMIDALVECRVSSPDHQFSLGN